MTETRSEFVVDASGVRAKISPTASRSLSGSASAELQERREVARAARIHDLFICRCYRNVHRFEHRRQTQPAFDGPLRHDQLSGDQLDRLPPRLRLSREPRNRLDSGLTVAPVVPVDIEDIDDRPVAKLPVDLPRAGVRNSFWNARESYGSPETSCLRHEGRLHRVSKFPTP